MTVLTWLSQSKAGEIAQARSLVGIRYAIKFPVSAIVCRWKEPFRQPAVERSRAIRGQLCLLLKFNLFECAGTKLPGQRILHCLPQSAADQVAREGEFHTGAEPIPDNDVDVRMICVPMDHCAPFDRPGYFSLDSLDEFLSRPLKICAWVFWRENDLEETPVAGLLPAFGKRSKRLLLRQSESFGVGIHSIAFGAFTLDVSSVGLPSPRGTAFEYRTLTMARRWKGEVLDVDGE